MSGVPQESVLVPISFLIYIIDLCDIVKTNVLNLRMKKVFRKVKNNGDKQQLQDYLKQKNSEMIGKIADVIQFSDM